MRKELLNKANLAWLVLSIVSFVVLTILMKVGVKDDQLVLGSIVYLLEPYCNVLC